MTHPVHVVVLVVVLLLVLPRDLVQVRVVDGELSVVLLQYSRGRTLDTQPTQRETGTVYQ